MSPVMMRQPVLLFLLVITVGSFISGAQASRSIVFLPEPISSLDIINTTVNQVYAPRLDDPTTRTFERCSRDTFTVYGPCTYQICYVYLYRSGYDGWIPYDVTIYAYNSKAVTFTYNVGVPRDTWYGHNYCRSRGAKSVRNLGWSLLSFGSTMLYTIAGLFRG